MKKSDTLVLFASPKKDGNTAKLLKAFLQKEAVNEYVFFDCYETLPKPCIDCGHCVSSFDCIFHDLDTFYHSLEQCRRLIIASPVYNNSFPAPLKAVIDRLQIYFQARFQRGIKPPIAIAKTADLLLTSGANQECKEIILPQILPCFSIIHATLQHYIHVNGLDQCENVAEKIQLQLSSLIK